MTRDQEPLGCLSVIFKLFGVSAPEQRSTVEFPYQRKNYFLGQAERSFFGALQNAVGGKYLIFSKVRLADLVVVRKGTDKRGLHFNRIQSKHIDFVLCNHEVVRPLLAIELDDASHERQDRKQRDEFVDSALAAAGLPILHVPARAGYKTSELAEAIRAKIGP